MAAGGASQVKGWVRSGRRDAALGHRLDFVLAAGEGRTDAIRDGLGRIVKVWGTGWSEVENPTAPSKEYTYAVSRTAPTVVTTKILRHTGDYRSEYILYDGLLRERETQAPSGTGIGRIITEWTRHPAFGGQAAERVSHRYSTSLRTTRPSVQATWPVRWSTT
ncbi:hypothetical protein [Streptomyces sp. WMMC940]|uniref:hypothetical protein n=1 Tax=Streptomyces sp. WMMC940 TaxID=3015153 RepID=UPI0022B731C2|nr:hypothetical protein [Streptomyces sp. WMMC940]MCZ7456197.1 hypothetical protein [Streptomyces sp. WMMC940]